MESEKAKEAKEKLETIENMFKGGSISYGSYVQLVNEIIRELKYLNQKD